MTKEIEAVVIDFKNLEVAEQLELLLMLFRFSVDNLPVDKNLNVYLKEVE